MKKFFLTNNMSNMEIVDLYNNFLANEISSLIIYNVLFCISRVMQAMCSTKIVCYSGRGIKCKKWSLCLGFNSFPIYGLFLTCM